MNIWKDCEQVPLTSLLSFIVDNRGKTVPLIDDKNGIKLIATNCIKNESLYPVYEKVRFLSEETYKTWFRAHPRPGDIIFVNKGTPGKVAFVPDPIDFCIAQDMMAFRVNPEIVYNKYLFAVLRSAKIQEQIRITSVGDVIPHFKKEFLNEIKIPLPDMKIQKYLGDMYFMYSEKIELNNKINTNLEQQAQALFKNWFVDSEPFGGKMPEGWKVGKLSELINVKYGKDHKKLDDENYPVYGSGGIMRYVDKFLYDKESVLIPRKGTLNNVFYINEPFWSVDTMFYTEMKKENIAKYVYFFVKSKDLNAMNAGSAVPSMTTEILNAMEVVIPSDEYLERFETIVSPMFKQIKQCIIENEKLVSLRDTLLPKLMNGELKI